MKHLFALLAALFLLGIATAPVVKAQDDDIDAALRPLNMSDAQVDYALAMGVKISNFLVAFTFEFRAMPSREELDVFLFDGLFQPGSGRIDPIINGFDYTPGESFVLTFWEGDGVSWIHEDLQGKVIAYHFQENRWVLDVGGSNAPGLDITSDTITELPQCMLHITNHCKEPLDFTADQLVGLSGALDSTFIDAPEGMLSDKVWCPVWRNYVMQ